MNTPKLFSVIIPTLNRAHLIKYAIASVLAQTCHDYEVVVVDSHSKDDTTQVVKNFKSKKIRYFNTPKNYSSPASWEYGALHARGDYLVVLADDDYFMPNMLEEVAKVITEKKPDIVMTGLATYHYPDFYDQKLRNVLLLREKYSLGVMPVSMKKLVGMMFQFRAKEYIPSIHSATFISKKIVNAVRKKHGAFFAEPLPDFISFPRSFARASSAYFIDRPLVIVGRPPASWSIQYSKVKKSRQIDAKKQAKFIYAPLHGQYMMNNVAEAFLRAKYGDEELFRQFDFSMNRYAVIYYQEMVLAELEGRDVKNDLKEFEKWLGRLPIDMQNSIRQNIKKIRLKISIKKYFRPFRGLLSLIKKIKSDKLAVKHISMDRWNVKNIDDCSHVMEKLL